MCSARAAKRDERKNQMRVCECEIAAFCCGPAGILRRAHLARRPELLGGLSSHCINLL